MDWGVDGEERVEREFQTTDPQNTSKVCGYMATVNREQGTTRDTDTRVGRRGTQRTEGEAHREPKERHTENRRRGTQRTEGEAHREPKSETSI
jgi:hypothetical protein